MLIRPAQSHAWLWSVLVLVVGVLIAGLSGGYQARSEQARRQAQFERQSDLTFNAVAQQVRAGGQLARSVQSSFLVSSDITQEDFSRLYESLNPRGVFPGLQAMLYSKRVIGKDGHYHYWTLYVAPVEGNEKLFGLDLSTQPKNMEAARRSEETHLPAMSEPFQLVQDGPPDPQKVPLGITIRIPVYPSAPPGEHQWQSVGSFGISFRLSDLIGAAIPDNERSQVVVRVYDATIKGGRTLLYQLGRFVPGNQTRTQSLGFGGRTWEIEMSPAESQEVAMLWPLVTFATISAFSILLSLSLFNLLRTRMRAMEIAREMTQKYRISEERFRLLNENLPGLVVLADHEGRIAYANRSCRDRMAIGEIVDQSVMDLFRVPALIDRLAGLSNNQSQLTLPRVQLVDKEGCSFWASISFSRMEMEGEPYILVLGSDVSEIIELAQQLDFQSKQLHFQATHDQLTGLCNRRDFEDRLASAIAEGHQGMVSALLYIDLDQFKVVNDTAGHMVGDHLLVRAAEGMRTLFEGDELLARMGGDEFGLLIRDATVLHAQAMAERVRKFFEQFSFTWEGVPYQVSCSIGIVMIDRAVLSQEDILSRVDAACYMAKERGRNRWQMFDEGAESAARRLEMEWVARIRQAISSNRLRLYYQDIIPICPKDTSGSHFEILVRMEDEKGDVISAFEFIPAAERYGLMPLIDRWVVERALENFEKLHPSGNIETCAINISGETVDDVLFEDFLISALTKNPEAARRICIEITETSAIRNMARLLDFIPRLRATGCRLALDDFGAGMSSFGYLKNLKVDLVKIDGSFIRDLDHDAMSHSIVSAVTDIAHKMDMEVVAEWVGSPVVLNMLRELGVDYAQGFYLHKPSPCLIPN